MKKLLLLCFTLLNLVSYSTTVESNDTTVVELINFTSESVYFRQGTPTTNIWQIGSPAKTNFTTALSAPNAIVTDTLNSYPVNNLSYFDLVFDFQNYDVPNHYEWPNLGIGFYYKIQTPEHKDGGFITVSYDSGQSWYNIIQDTSGTFMFSPAFLYFPNYNLYTQNDTLANGEPGFSGENPEWTYTEFYWVMDQVTKSASLGENLIVRFNFYSDSIAENMDGWMIDDLRIFYNHDFGSVHELLPDNSVSVYPNPSNGIIHVKLNNFKAPLNYSIFDVLGTCIQTGRFDLPDSKAAIENKGVYFIRVEDGIQTITQKIIIH